MPTVEIDLTLLDKLILARLLPKTAKLPSEKDVRESLAPFFAHRQPAAEWQKTVGESLARLRAAGLCEPKSTQLTEVGRLQASRFLGFESPPARLDWRAVKQRYLPALALGLSANAARERFKGVASLRAVILKNAHQLPLAQEVPTLNQAVEALAWKCLGVDSGRGFSKAEVMALLIARLLDTSPGKLDQIKGLAASAAVGARNGTAGELYTATVRQWVDAASQAQPAPEPTTAGDTSDHAQPTAAELSLDQFASRVAEAARRTPSGHFGEHKVFISHVWGHLNGQTPFARMNFDSFKRRLTEANHQGLLQLSQADLVEAMSPADVAESETRYLNSTFHFIRI